MTSTTVLSTRGYRASTYSEYAVRPGRGRPGSDAVIYDFNASVDTHLIADLANSGSFWLVKAY